jgi:hypothetical protein
MGRWALIVLVGLCAGCEEDGAPDAGDVLDTFAVDGVDDTDTSPDEVDEVVEVDAVADVEVTPVDPCEPNPCTAPGDGACSLDRRAVLTPAATGLCSAVGGVASCTYPDEVETCGLEAFCSLSECVEVGSFCDFPLDAGPWSFGVVHRYAGFGEIDPETGDPVDECCFDLNGDGAIDNRFGTMMRSIGSFFPIDLNEWFEERMRSFTVSFVSQLRGLPEVWSEVLVGRHKVDLLGFVGRPTAGSADPFTQLGLIEIFETSFSNQSVLPRVHVELELEDGAITGAYGVIGFGLGAELRNAEVTVMRAEGTLMLDEEGLGFGAFMDGQPGVKFGGAISRSEWLSIWNDHVDSFCVCTTFLEGDVSAIDLETGKCNTPIQTCTEPDSICQVFTSPLCHPLVDQMAADLDTDGDGINDSISAGWWSKSVPVRVVDKIRSCP